MDNWMGCNGDDDVKEEEEETKETQMVVKYA
jgi:hypothetical protein